MNNLKKTFTAFLVLLTFGQIALAQTFGGGSGTEANPYIIANETHWDALADAVNNGTGTYASAYYKLNGDLVGLLKMVGNAEHPFQGTFDGNGHKLGLNYQSDYQYYAPFRYVNGATIKNLIATGSIHSFEGYSSKCVASFVAHSVGTTTLTNCHSEVQINTNVGGVQHNGGLVAEIAGGSFTISGCYFNGVQLIFNNASGCGGFVGWLAQDATVTIENSILNPYADLTYLGSNSFSFVNAEDPNGITITNSYYTSSMGQAQGKLARYIIPGDKITVAFYGNATTYSLSGITCYDATPGLLFGGRLCAGAGDQVSLNITNTVGATSFLVNTEPIIGDGNPYSITMPNQDANIYTALTGTGTQSDPYLIKSANDFNQIATLVESGQSLSGQFIQLDGDISVTKMIGNSSCKFSGTFDGNGKTLTVNYNASEIYTAPFHYVDGATIKNLTVAGTIITNRRAAAGFIGESRGTTTLVNCQSDVTINCNDYTGDGGHGGLVGRNEGGDLTINGCAFTGKLLGSNAYGCGGFVGYNVGNLSITGSLFSPTQVTMGTQESKTFACYSTQVPNITDSYYTQTLGDAQGERIYILNLADGITSSVTPTFGRLVSLSGVNVTLTLTVTPPLGYGPVVTVKDSDNQNVTVNHVGDEFSFTMPAKDVTITLGYSVLPITGDGTPENPYLIMNSAHLKTVAARIVNETSNYPSACYRLEDNVDIIIPVSDHNSTMLGNSYHPFRGTFDGNGYTITVQKQGYKDGDALFPNVNNATICNLHVVGSIDGSYYHYFGGLVGFAHGTVTIENCHVSTNLHIFTNGGGIVGHGEDATLNIKGCVYDGNIRNSTGATGNSLGVGGLVGWASSGCTMNITDCLFLGTYICDGNAYIPFSPIACTSNPNVNVNIVSTYYTIDPDTDPDNNPNNIIYTGAKRAYSISSGNGISITIQENITSNYNVSDITIYEAGIENQGVIYVSHEEQIHLNINAVIPESHTLIGYTVNSGIIAGTTNPYTLSFVNDDVVINANAVEQWRGSGSEEDPYVIMDRTQLDLLSYCVNISGTSFSETYFKLGADIEYDPNMLTIDNDGDGVTESNYTTIGNSNTSFRGHLDGGYHTISGIRVVKTDRYQGLFGRANGSKLTNIILSDTDITGGNYTGGFVGYKSGGEVTDCHVTSTVTIRTVGTGISNHGGIVGRNYSGDISQCSSAATLTIEKGNTGCSNYGGIVGYAESGNITRNLAIGATIPMASGNYGAVYGGKPTSSQNLTFQNNYRNSCNISGTTANDITANDGCVYGYLITLDEFVTSSATQITVPEHKDLNSAGALETVAALTYNVASYSTTITLGNTLPAGCIFDRYTVRGNAIPGNTFTMGSYNVNVGIVFSVDQSAVSKAITGYGDGNDRWVLIASPVGTVNPEDVNHMFDNTYDLYRFNQAADLEWENYKQEEGNHYHFNLEVGRGYLYANSHDVTLVFLGTPYSGNGEVTLNKTADSRLEGWNLVGNPFTATAYIADGRSFYVMNDEGSDIEPTERNSIAPMEGIFVLAANDGETMTFTTTEPENNNGKGLVLNLSKGHNVIDRAIVRFGKGRQLPKFQIRGNSTKLYIPQDNRNYAVVNAEHQGEMPVNFKAKENGTYTLNLSSEKTAFNYLHLIDNLTGDDVDLLQTPNYTFEAKIYDYASRFKLVFDIGDANEDDHFAFISNGELIVAGEGYLQVFDILGHQLFAKHAPLTSHLLPPPGVYMLRLIDGENVRTQKIIIK